MKTMRLLAPVLGLMLAFTAAARADTSDFALFDADKSGNEGFESDSGAVCSANSAFTYNVAVANWGEDGQVWVTYKDGSSVKFPIAANASFAFSQAAGSPGSAGKSWRNTNASSAVRVWNGGTAAVLSGSMSASGQGRPTCMSCDEDGGAGDAACDNIVPNDAP